MGEEVIKKVEKDQKEEAPPAPAEAEKKEDAEKEPPPLEGEETKDETANMEPPPPPPPVILSINLHCTGCVNKIKRCILRCKGVEGVEVDVAQNQVTVKGILDPQGICDRLRKRTMRNCTVISPPPPPPPTEGGDAAAKEDPPPPTVVHSQVSEVRTVELLVNMHCEACAQQLQKMIIKMRGVQSADADASACKLTVTGTISADKVVQYIHRRTGKLATVVPPPPSPQPPKVEDQPKAEDSDSRPEEPPAECEKKPEEPVADDGAGNKEGEGDKEDEAAKPEDGSSEKKEGDYKARPEVMAVDGFPPEEMMKRMMYWPYSHKHLYRPPSEDPEAMMAKMMPMVHHPYAVPMMLQSYAPPPPPPPPPLPATPPMMYPHYNYGMVERLAPPPQYFSDENPNACIIS